MKTLLMTGGSGFFGKSVLDAFRRGVLAPFRVGRIVALSRHASRLRSEAPELCGPGIELVDADLLQLTSTFEADVVIHAAASSDARRYQSNPVEERRIIVDGTRRVCELVGTARNRPRLLHVSSGAVYGRQPPELAALAEDAPQVEDATSGKETYTQAKREAEALVRDAAERSGVCARIARCFAFVGTYLPRDQHFAIGNFLGNALRGEAIQVRARHPVIRSYLHADDLAFWLLRMASADGDECAAYNVGSDEAVSLRELAALVARIGGVEVSLPDESPASAGDVAAQTHRYVPDIGKARRELGLGVTIPLRDAVERTFHALAETASREGDVRSREPAGMPR